MYWEHSVSNREIPPKKLVYNQLTWHCLPDRYTVNEIGELKVKEGALPVDYYPDAAQRYKKLHFSYKSLRKKLQKATPAREIPIDYH